MKHAFLLFALTASAGLTADDSYLAKIIACTEDEAVLVSSSYDAFLALISQRELPKEGLRFPARLAEKTETGSIIARSYYIAPNELRGFEIFVPKDCMTKKEGVLFSSVVLVVDAEDSRQGHSLFSLKKKPNQAPGPTAASGRGSSLTFGKT